MPRPRSKNEPSTYQPRPAVPPEIAQRVTVVKAILGERLTITAAAEQLGIARVNMQTLAHRADAAIIESMTPKPSGPRPRSPRERELELEVKRLQRENAKLQEQLQAADDMMGAAGEIIRSLRGLPPRPSSRSSSGPSPSTSKPKSASDDSDPEPPTDPSTTSSTDPQREHSHGSQRSLTKASARLAPWGSASRPSVAGSVA